MVTNEEWKEKNIAKIFPSYTHSENFNLVLLNILILANNYCELPAGKIVTEDTR